MKTREWNKPKKDLRLPALRRFATAITILTCLGHAWLGFETPLAFVFISLATAYSVELLLETIEAWSCQRELRYGGGLLRFIDFLLPAHITGLAIAMLLFPGAEVMPLIFANVVGIGSKFVFRAPVRGRWRHFLNPSNTGIAIVLILMPRVGIAAPYQFTEAFRDTGNWLLPAIIIALGTFLNAVFTGRIVLIASWLGAFALQATTRFLVNGTPRMATFDPLTGMAFLLFTFYMVSDPGTTPFDKRGQLVFGVSVAAAYGILLQSHIVFTLFFALFAVCILRGLRLYALAWLDRRSRAAASAPLILAAETAGKTSEATS